MTRKVRMITSLFIITSIFFFATQCHLYHYDFMSAINDVPKITITISSKNMENFAIHENISLPVSQVNSLLPDSISSVSILMPDWEVFVIVSPDYTHLISHHNSYICVFETGEISPAILAGELQFPARSLFKCELPKRSRWRLPFKQPKLIKSSENRNITPAPATSPEMLRWTFLVYDSLTTDDDVVLFVKGLKNRQGINKGLNNLVVPSVAYYTRPRKLEGNEKLERARVCTCTMVYNVGKFLKEWVLYHSKIGVEKFVLYDNASNADLNNVVDELVRDGYDVKTYSWVWPQTQEAGFSHSAIYAKDSCSWMMYIDGDEFVYSPLWSKLSHPSKSLLPSMLPNPKNVPNSSLDKRHIGEITISCYEYGPSNKKFHPITGVTQGYNCRRKVENRHNSIVLLDAIDHSLCNVIHHFILKQGYKIKKVNACDMVLNHYKFQAWFELKAKFRRRVSAYVVDWTKELNPRSNDRTPGLGFSSVEPKDWPLKFCEVYDNGLKDLTRRWFGLKSPNRIHYRMVWQR
uniref:Glycosyltransferase family 92 protein n=1 Tax=Solanum tuberosum TaxID=4113 RepID=M1DPD9_SOLTU